MVGLQNFPFFVILSPPIGGLFHDGHIAQGLEHNAYNVAVDGSNPSMPTYYFIMTDIHAQFTILPEEAEGRLDIIIAEKQGVTRSQAQKWIKQGWVKVNKKLQSKSSHAVVEGDLIAIDSSLPIITDDALIPEKGSEGKSLMGGIHIIHETNDYLVVNKPTGILVHPTQAGEKYTLTDWLIARYPAVATVGESKDRPGIVHRLDKEASGILVIAKNQPMFDHLKKQFQDRTIEKEYSVLVHGIMSLEHDEIDFDIDRGRDGAMVSRPHVDSLSLRSVSNRQPGKEALTEYWLEKQYARFALLRVKIHSGRTHQIRVHFFAYTHPVVGDTLYFNKKLNRRRDLALGRLFLHATRLCFMDLSGEKHCFEEKLPDTLQNFLHTIS